MAGVKGRSGRLPVPAALKLLAGNPGKRPINAAEPKPTVKLPACPRFLQGEARKEWRRLGRRLVKLGLMTEIDKSALAIYCQAWARWVDAEQVLARTGVVLERGHSIAISPFVAISRTAMAQMLRVMVEFGMTPSSRSRLKAEPPQDEDDPLEVLRRRGAKKR